MKRNLQNFGQSSGHPFEDVISKTPNPIFKHLLAQQSVRFPSSIFLSLFQKPNRGLIDHSWYADHKVLARSISSKFRITFVWFLSYDHHYATHSWNVESTYEWCASRISRKVAVAHEFLARLPFLSQDVCPKLEEDTDTHLTFLAKLLFLSQDPGPKLAEDTNKETLFIVLFFLRMRRTLGGVRWVEYRVMRLLERM